MEAGFVIWCLVQLSCLEILGQAAFGGGTGLVIPVGHQAGAGGDQLTDQHVLLQANQVVDLALNSGIGQDLSGLLEGGGGQEGIGSQSGLGDTQQDCAGLGQTQLGFTLALAVRLLWWIF